MTFFSVFFSPDDSCVSSTVSSYRDDSSVKSQTTKYDLTDNSSV